MESPGEYIGRERKLREISLEDVSKAIKVHVKLLKALEADDYDELPHTTFIKGFFRAYAKHLGLDDNDIVLRYEDYRKEFYDHIQKENEPPVSFPTFTNHGKLREITGEPSPRRKQFIAIAAAVVVVLIAAAYFIFSGPSEEPLPLSGGTEPQAQASDKEGAEGEGRADILKDSPGRTDTVKVLASGDKKSAGTKPPVSGEAPRRTVKPTVEKITRVEKGPQTAESAASAPLPVHTLVAAANSETWMRVEIDGLKSREVLLQPGESARWSGEKGFSILIGNAGGVTFTFDGVDMGVPGGAGKTVRVNFPEGVKLPRVVVKKVLPPKKAEAEGEKPAPPVKEAVKAAPAKPAVVEKDAPADGAPVEKAEAKETPPKDAAPKEAPAEADVVSDLPDAPDVIEETPEEAPSLSPSEEPAVKEISPEEPVTEEAGAPVAEDGTAPEEAPNAGEGISEADPAIKPSVEEPMPPADEAEAVVADPDEEIDLMEDDF